MKKTRILPFIFMLLLINACKTLTNTNTQVTSTAKPVFVAEEEVNILFVILKVNKGNPETYEVTKISKTQGYLKKENTRPVEENDIDFQIDVLDKNGQVLKQLYHRNPFQRTLEYADDERNLKTVTLEESNPLLRLKMNWQPEIHALLIKKRANKNVVQSDKIVLAI